MKLTHSAFDCLLKHIIKYCNCYYKGLGKCSTSFIYSFHQFISDLFSGDLGHSICLIERDRNISCLGSGVSGLCIGLTPVAGPPHSDDEYIDTE